MPAIVMLAVLGGAALALVVLWRRRRPGRPGPGSSLPAARGCRTAGPDEPEPRVLDFRADAFRAISRRVWWALAVCAAVWLGGLLLVHLGGFPAHVLGIRRSTLLKIAFCASQPPLVVCLVILISDWLKGKVTHEGLIAGALALLIFWWSSAMIMGSARNLAFYGY